MADLTLVSHHLCPYVQRAAIALTEKGTGFDRSYIDLAQKPDWFTEISPLGKVPLLLVKQGEDRHVIFESAVILEYLDDTVAPKLHPADPLERARHRSWIEFGSSILGAISRFYNARDRDALAAGAKELRSMFVRVENELTDGPWFAGDTFSLVDAVYAPIFRYFDVFDVIEDFGVLKDLRRIDAWRVNLSQRPSVLDAVQPGYEVRLRRFLQERGSAISDMILVEQGS